jgi:exodeoxyribonuclease VII small subunit
MADKKQPASPSTPTSPARAEGEGGPSFEEALARLETIVEELEGSALTLEESIARYEEGVRLARRLTQTLDEAEQRIERLVEADEDGVPATEPIELEGQGAEPGGRRDEGRARPAPRAAPQRRAEKPPRPGPDPDELPF